MKRLFTKEHIKKLKIAHVGMLGKKHSEETKEKMRRAAILNGNKPPVELGEKNHNWKGNKAGYWAIHKWIVRERGNPDICEHCGKNNLHKNQIHWANKDHRYRRKLKDYIRLCQSCHRIYDIKKGLINAKNHRRNNF